MINGAKRQLPRYYVKTEYPAGTAKSASGCYGAKRVRAVTA